MPFPILAWPIWLAGTAAVAGAGYVVKKVFFDDDKDSKLTPPPPPAIILSGRKGAGKDTVLNALKGEKFDPNKKYEVYTSTSRHRLEIGDETYDVLNTQGLGFQKRGEKENHQNAGGNVSLEAEKNKLREEREQILEFFVFSIKECLENGCKELDDIMCEIDVAGEISKEQGKKGIVFRVVGTHKDDAGEHLVEIEKRLEGFNFKLLELSEEASIVELQNLVAEAMEQAVSNG